MTKNERIYRSILKRLSLVPADQLQIVDAYLDGLIREIQDKEQARLKILELAGGWNDMTEEDFQDFLHEAKNSGNKAFGL